MPPLTSRSFVPEFARDIDNSTKLCDLLFCSKRITSLAAGKSALRADGQPIQRNILRRFANAFLQERLGLKFPCFGRYESEHDNLVIRHSAERLEASSSWRIILKKIEVQFEFSEHLIGHRVVATRRLPAASTVTPADVHSDPHIRRRSAQDSVHHIDVMLKERLPRIAPSS